MGDKYRLVSVYSGDYAQAEIVKGRLESEGIPAMLKSEFAEWVLNALGEVRVMVPENLAREAGAIVADHEYGEPEDEIEDEAQEEG